MPEQIPLQPMEKTTVMQVVPLQLMHSITLSRSLMEILNSIGPGTDP